MESKSFLDDLKNLSKGAIKCLYKLSESHNKAAIMTFSAKPTLQVNFCDECYKDANFLAKTEKNIQYVYLLNRHSNNQTVLQRTLEKRSTIVEDATLGQLSS